jgi:predicted TIM-barrel fold metal-dependent hydrolase
MGFNPLAFASLAEACPQTRIIVAHFGGHHCLDFMMLAKRLPNIWFDLSYSLLYYTGSSVVGNLMYCCRSMKFQRIMYGSDYPDRPIGISLQRSLEIFSEVGLSGEDVDALAWKNAVECFGWTDL